MNKIVNKLFFVLILMLTTFVAHAKQGPPPPAAPPVGAPIDENLFVLVILFILFGFYKIYTNIRIKTSK